MSAHPVAIEDDPRLGSYAALIVRTALRLGDGDDLLVLGRPEHHPLVGALADEAYRAGVRYVHVLYTDPDVRRALVAAGPDASLSYTPPWLSAAMEQAVEGGFAAVSIGDGGTGAIFRDLDPGRVAQARTRDFERHWIRGVLERRLVWTAVTYPTARWAEEVFGEPDVARLWDALAHTLRLDEPDPAASWERRWDELEARAEELTARGFDALRYRGPGTDLEVGLIEGGRWIAARGRTKDGRVHAANVPTEEAFTSPHRDRAEGRVRSHMPLDLRGAVVQDLELEFRGGEIVEVRASTGADAVRAELETDEGARRLGEVALVDGSSRVGDAGIVFRHTLLDENASSHIAFGAGLPWVLGDAPPEEQAERGLNVSASHIDFMIGSPELEIDGVERGGGVVPLLRGGAWQL
jgi:aminopeptidase